MDKLPDEGVEQLLEPRRDGLVIRGLEVKIRP
jgi:hypothetical protein